MTVKIKLNKDLVKIQLNDEVIFDGELSEIEDLESLVRLYISHGYMVKIEGD